MHVGLAQAVRQDGPHQVGVAVVVEVHPGEQLVDVWVAACAQQVVTAAAVLVDAVVDAVRGEGEHGAQEGQAGPESVVRGDVRGLELTGACGPEPLLRVVQVPAVEVADLSAFGRDDPADLPSADLPGSACADWDRYLLDESAAGCCGNPVVERPIDIERTALGGPVCRRWLFAHLVSSLLGGVDATAGSSAEPPR